MFGIVFMTRKRFLEQQLELKRLRTVREEQVNEIYLLHQEIRAHIVEGTKAGVDYYEFRPWERV